MKVFILAAGLGTRMGALTRSRPKPLLCANGEALLVRLVRRLYKEGFNEIIINTSVFSDQFEEAIYDNRIPDLNVMFSHEGDRPLNTADGVRAVLHWLGESPFLLICADVFIDIELGRLRLPYDKLAQLVLVDNPEHRECGDFYVVNERDIYPMVVPEWHPAREHAVVPEGYPTYTYSGVCVLSPLLLQESFGLGSAGLGELLSLACVHKIVGFVLHDGYWMDVGTPDRLRRLESYLVGREGEAPTQNIRSRHN